MFTDGLMRVLKKPCLVKGTGEDVTKLAYGNLACTDHYREVDLSGVICLNDAFEESRSQSKGNP